MIRGETQTVGGPITCLVTFCLAHNSWSVATFCVGDHHDSHGSLIESLSLTSDYHSRACDADMDFISVGISHDYVSDILHN